MAADGRRGPRIFLLCFVLMASAVPVRAEKAEVQAAFTPADNIALMIVERIRAAQASIRMQAYLFTDRRIAAALLGALKRGVHVDIVADGAQEEAGGTPHLGALRRAGARVFLTEVPGAAHNKVIIIDADRPAAAVITGSYNYTRAANSRNAENVVIISGSPGLARRFVENFDYHRSLAKAWP